MEIDTTPNIHAQRRGGRRRESYILRRQKITSYPSQTLVLRPTLSKAMQATQTNPLLTRLVGRGGRKTISLPLPSCKHNRSSERSFCAGQIGEWDLLRASPRHW